MSVFLLEKNFQVISADDLLAKDKRPFVLYLRSFEFDSVAAINHKTPIAVTDAALGMAFQTVTAKTYEETLAKTFSVIDPCIAIGKPGLELPIAGFSRKKLSMDDWQAEVKKFMRQAALIIICAGNTEGDLWELKQAKENVPLQRLLILITQHTSDDWWKHAKEVFGQDLPKFIIYSEQPLHGLIYFDENGTPHDELIIPFLSTRQ